MWRCIDRVDRTGCIAVDRALRPACSGIADPGRGRATKILMAACTGGGSGLAFGKDGGGVDARAAAVANVWAARFGHAVVMIDRFSDGPPAMPQLAAEPAPGLSSAKMVRHNVAQGEHEVSRDPHLVLTTVLGSCIACCLYDPVVCIGGFNHFLLAETPANMQDLHGDASRYGHYAM